ncbi:hypothetical protein [Atrimonas thermophila]|uniref:hypothetical protein n=1 Tax=Atrimonas thermophila TaxID=3064161 RepID=UPI00399CB68A
MPETLWHGFRVYYYDEEDGRNHFKEFVEKNPEVVNSLARFMAFMEDVESGRGMVREQMRRGELKKTEVLKIHLGIPGER